MSFCIAIAASVASSSNSGYDELARPLHDTERGILSSTLSYADGSINKATQYNPESPLAYPSFGFP